MAEEATPKTETAEKAPEGNKNNGKRGGKKDEKPIEELYDLSKPIPRVSVCGPTQMTYLRRNVLKATYSGRPSWGGDRQNHLFDLKQAMDLLLERVYSVSMCGSCRVVHLEALSWLLLVFCMTFLAIWCSHFPHLVFQKYLTGRETQKG